MPGPGISHAPRIFVFSSTLEKLSIHIPSPFDATRAWLVLDSHTLTCELTDKNASGSDWGTRSFPWIPISWEGPIQDYCIACKRHFAQGAGPFSDMGWFPGIDSSSRPTTGYRVASATTLRINHKQTAVRCPAVIATSGCTKVRVHCEVEHWYT